MDRADHPDLAPLDTALLLSFVAVAETGSLTRGASRLGLAQPTVSLRLKRLETELGQALFERGPRRLSLTPAGEVLLGYARRILALSDEARARLGEAEMEGVVRLGTPEDFATTHLAGVLARFAATHPRTALSVTTDLTLNLLERFRAGEFDLVLIKREPGGPGGGVRVWREALVWAALREDWFAADGALPLVVSPHPCVYRRRAMEALQAAGRAWRVAYTSTSLAGTQAAVRAGLGLTVLPRGMVPPDLVVLGPEDGAPDLRETEIALLTAEPLSRPAARLAEHVVRSLERG
ncbi:MAG: LysR substrate-binding domain-containing protein [Acetobacteraceae bacterium]|nr:LysR substrate-binding domain-containing protein [Acetobacteraceae bacterium]